MAPAIANPSNINNTVNSSSSSSEGQSILLHNPRMSIYWTSEEQSALEYLLEKYASEIPIVRYANISQALTDKAIRDVVMRCRWTKAKKNGTMVDVEMSCIFGGDEGLVERTTRILDQISANISDLKIGANVDLLCEARANILEMIKNLPEMDIPFPFKLNLANSVLPPP